MITVRLDYTSESLGLKKFSCVDNCQAVEIRFETPFCRRVKQNRSHNLTQKREIRPINQH